MRFLIRFLLLCLLPMAGWAQSSLPPCPSSGYKHNCFGADTWTAGQFKGDQYVGEFKDGTQHGQGTYTWANGNQYVGEFKDGKRHGKGTYTWTAGQFKGDKYVGEFKDSKRNGQGTYTFANGGKHVGEWRDGLPNGQGIEYRADGTIVKSGQWADGKLVNSYALDRNRFPFDGTTQTASTTVDAGRAERDRLAAEAEAARRRQRELEAQLEAERKRRVDAESRGKSQASSTGTGFSVAPGFLVTNQHVIDGCKRLEVLSRDGRRSARVIDSDELVDLALLRVTGLGGGVAPVRRVGSVRLGEPAYAFGFPLTGILSESGNFTSGNVSSLRGMRDSASQIQISTPVQPGNSGGALSDASGAVIGVVVSKLNASAVARTTGDIPQNVNFAVSLQALSDFLRKNNVPVRTVDRGATLDAAQLADLMLGFTHRVECLDQPEVAARPEPRGAAVGQTSNNTTVVLKNRSREPILNIFVSPQNASTWGADLLGARVLHAGGIFTLEPPANLGCVYNVRVEYPGGRHEEKIGQDFCSLLELVFSGEFGQNSAASSSNWELVSTSSSGSKRYIDPSTIRRDGNLRRFWVLVDYPPPQSDGTLSQRVYEELDCREERRRGINITSFRGSMASGDIVGSGQGEGGWQQIAPGTQGAAIMRYVCAR